MSRKPIHKWPDYLFDRIKETTKSHDKWLTLSYISSPGHTPLDFSIYKPEDIIKYSKEFASEKDPQAASYILELIKNISENDQEYVIFILGDHGAWISRGIEKKVPAMRPITPREFFQERHAVVAAVYPKDFCVDEFKEPLSTVRIGRIIVKCLSGGKDPLPTEYQANDDYYLDYLYE